MPLQGQLAARPTQGGKLASRRPTNERCQERQGRRRKLSRPPRLRGEAGELTTSVLSEREGTENNQWSRLQPAIGWGCGGSEASPTGSEEEQALRAAFRARPENAVMTSEDRPACRPPNESRQGS